MKCRIFIRKKETTIVIIQQYREYPDKYPKFKYNTCYSSTLKAYMQGTGRRFKYNTCYYSTEQWLALDDPEKIQIQHLLLFKAPADYFCVNVFLLQIHHLLLFNIDWQLNFRTFNHSNTTLVTVQQD